MALVSSYANTSFLFRWCDLIYAKIIPSVNPFFFFCVPSLTELPVMWSLSLLPPTLHSAFGMPSYYPDVAQWNCQGVTENGRNKPPLPRWLIYILVPQCAGPVTQPCALCPVFSCSSSSSSSSECCVIPLLIRLPTPLFTSMALFSSHWGGSCSLFPPANITAQSLLVRVGGLSDHAQGRNSWKQLKTAAGGGFNRHTTRYKNIICALPLFSRN